MKRPAPLPSRRGWIFHLLSCLVAAVAFAQVPSGSIAGRVRHAQTGAYLEGAEVAVVGTALSTFTLRDGSFALDRVPAGPQRLRVTYAGLDAQELSVTAGAAARDVALTADVYRMETFTVASQREGDAVAIAKQRAATNVMNVVSLEGKENVADGNLGNFLQQLPGVVGNFQAGDIVGIGVRGIPPDMTGVTMDGQRMASAIAGFSPVGDRAAQIDQISPDFIKEVRLFKASTPDVDPASLGGGVDIVTKSALDYKNRVLTYRVGGTHTRYRSDNHRWGPSGSFTFMDTFGRERQWGLTLSSSYTRTIVNRDTMETVRNNVANASFTGLRMIDDMNDRIRAGGGAKLEWRASPALSLYANLQYNYYTFDNVRQDRSFGGVSGTAEASYATVTRAQIEAGAIPRTAAGAIAGIAPGRTDDRFELIYPRLTYRTAKEEKESRQFKLSAGGEARVLGGRLDFLASHNPTSFDNNYMGMIVRRDGGFGVVLDSTANRERPVVTQTFGSTVFQGTDFDNWLTDQVYEQADRSEEEITALAGNFERRFGGRLPWTLKAGAQFRSQHQLRDRYRPIWDYRGADGVAGRNPATGRNDDNLAQFRVPGPGYSLFDNHFGRWDVLSWSAARPYFNIPAIHYNMSPTLLVPRVDVARRQPLREVTEDVTAGYAMGTARLADFTVLTGVRWELTEIEGRGSFTDPANLNQTVSRREGDYTKLFPSFHLRYEPRRNLVARASWSTTSARPQLSQLYPDFSVSYNTAPGASSLGTVTLNNVNLRPNYSNNYDIGLDYYLEPAGVISAGYFYKDVKDWIASLRDVIPSGQNNGFGGSYAGLDLSTQTNLSKATFEGYELNYVQRLRFLPAPFSGLQLNANYTYTKTQGTYATGLSELGNFVPKTWNLGLSYAWRKFNVSLTHNYRSAYLYRRGVADNTAEYIDARSSTGVNLQYKLRPWATLYFDVTDLFDQPSVWYRLRDRSRVSTVEQYGIRFGAGVSGRF